jgi:hypothetical protein
MTDEKRHGFTKGPWRYDPNDTLNGDRAGGIVVDLVQEFAEERGVEHATSVIAEVCVAEGDVAEADGRLMAASPTMLEGLRDALAASRGRVNGRNIAAETRLKEVETSIVATLARIGFAEQRS